MIGVITAGKELSMGWCIISDISCLVPLVLRVIPMQTLFWSLHSQQREPSYRTLIFTCLISYFISLSELWCQRTLVSNPPGRHPCVYKIQFNRRQAILFHWGHVTFLGPKYNYSQPELKHTLRNFVLQESTGVAFTHFHYVILRFSRNDLMKIRKSTENYEKKDSVHMWERGK